MKDFKSHLKFYRERADMPKAELARYLGVTSQYIINIEHGHKEPPREDKCNKIADALELNKKERYDLIKAAFFEKYEAKGFKDFIKTIRGKV